MRKGEKERERKGERERENERERMLARLNEMKKKNGVGWGDEGTEKERYRGRVSKA